MGQDLCHEEKGKRKDRCQGQKGLRQKISSIKVKATSKAMRSQDARHWGETCVMRKRGRGRTGVKGIKFVDKQMS
jgi:hypothetical protein